MKVLIACEESQAVMHAFRLRGHEAYSCDLQPCSGSWPEYHIQGDVRLYLSQHWDLIIAHPPCTHLSSSGARWFKAKQIEQAEAVEFFMLFTRLPHVARVCIENPVGIMSTRYRKPDQIIQPYEFGHDVSKRTCLWLKGLPLLRGTKRIEPRLVNGKPRWGNQAPCGADKTPPSPDRGKLRSKTYNGVAQAMATQWG